MHFEPLGPPCSKSILSSPLESSARRHHTILQINPFEPTRAKYTLRLQGHHVRSQSARAKCTLDASWPHARTPSARHKSSLKPQGPSARDQSARARCTLKLSGQHAPARLAQARSPKLAFGSSRFRMSASISSTYTCSSVSASIDSTCSYNTN
jgi:hypothetical protein